MPPPLVPPDGWRSTARLQRQSFERERGTASTWLLGDLGTRRTLHRKLAWIREHLWAAEPGGRYLELGVGEGTEGGCDRLPPRRVALDPAHAALRRARTRSRGDAGAAGEPADQAGVAWVAALGEELPFRDGSFDGVLGIDVLHHLASPPRAFAEMARVLRPGGRLAFVEPNPLFPVNWVFLLSRVERGLFAIRPARLRRWAEDAGLVGLEVGNVPVFFPSGPPDLAATYAEIEDRLGRTPVLRALSTGRSVVAARPRERMRPLDAATRQALDVAAHDLNAELRLPHVERALAGASGPYLDVGSGPGYAALKLLATREASVVCLDVDAGNLAALAETLRASASPGSRVSLVRADATRLPFRDAAFGTVLASEVLEHVADDRAAAAELARVLRDGGTAVVTVPTSSHRHASLLDALEVETVHDRPGPEHHVRDGYPPEALERLLAGAGLRPVARVEWVRPASRVVIDLVALAHLLVERIGHGRRAWTWSEAVAAARSSLAFRVYRRVYPLLSAITRLDALFERVPGWQVLVRAQRRRRQ